MIKKIISILVVLISYVEIGEGQQYSFRSLDYSNEILSDNFSCFYEDNEGFIWIGTNNGLYRYSGEKFEPFFHVPGDTNSISNNNILSICEDAYNNLWVGTSNGLNLFNREKNSFTWYFKSANNPVSISHHTIKALKLLQDSSFWIATREGLNKLVTREDGSFGFLRYYPERRDESSSSEWSIEVLHEDTQGGLWAGTWGGGIIKFNKINGSFTHYYPPYPLTSINDHVIVAMESRDDSTIWAASYNGLIYTFNTRALQYDISPYKHPAFSKISNTSTSINTLLKDSEGLLWIGASESLMIYNPSSKKIEYQGTPVSSYTPQTYKDQITAIFEDSKGHVWVGHNGYGVDIYDKHYKKLSKYHFDLKTPEKYRDYITGMQLDDDGFYWLSTWGDGMIKVDYHGQVVNRFMPSQFSEHAASNIITSIAIDISGNIWLGTHYGLIGFDRKKEKFTNIYLHDPTSPVSFRDNHISRLITDDDGFLWVISQESVRSFDPVRKIIKKVPFVENLRPEKIVEIMRDTDDNYWIGTFQGLYRYNVKDSIYTSYITEPKNKNSLCSNDIRNILQDYRGNIWIATNNGISMLDPISGNFNNFPDSRLQFLSFSSGIVEDKLKNIWLLTPENLLVFNPSDNQITKYTSEDGLSRFANHMTISKEGYIHICDEKGFYRINPDSLYKNQEIPPVYITQLYLSGKPANINKKPLNGVSPMYKESITLKHDQNNFGFLIMALNYRNPEKNSYRYKLEGYNDEWINNGTSNEVTFMNLPPGKYTFKAKGSNNDNVWNNEPVTMRVTVLRPPWQRWWAYSIYIFLIATAIVTYKIFTISRERERARLAIDQMKLSFFINISHELRTPLTLVTGPLERLLRQEHDIAFREKLTLIYRNASRMQHLVNQILDIRKIDVGKLKPVVYYSDFHPFINNILISFKSYAEENNIGFHEYKQIAESKMWFEPDMLEKAISNLLINAFKHTTGGSAVSIHVQDHDKVTAPSVFNNYSKNMHRVKTGQKSFQGGQRYLSIEIADCGEGLNNTEFDKIFERFYQNSSSKRHAFIGSGIGLSLTRDLVELMHGYIFIQSKQEMGTKFVVFLPVSRDAFKNDHVHDDEIEYELFQKDYSKVLAYNPVIQKETGNKITKKSTSGKDIHILVVDDNTELLEYIHDVLSDTYQITTATNGESGLKKALNNKFDLIISDIMMPVMDGLAFCQKVKDDVRINHIPIILLTAKSSLESEIEGLDSGADDYIAKPFNTEILKKRVENIITSRKRIWEKIAHDSEIIPQGLELTTREEDFLKKAVGIVEEHLSDTEFSQEIFCKKIGMSKASLYRKINTLTNQSINEFVRNIRLKKAAEMLRCGKQLHIAELGYKVGFSEPSYFTKKFRELFGVTPKVYNTRYIMEGVKDDTREA